MSGHSREDSKPLNTDTPPVKPLMRRGIEAGSKLTGLGPRTVWSLCRCNALPHRRVGRAILFVVAEVEAWIEAGCPTRSNAADSIRKSMRKGVR